MYLYDETLAKYGITKEFFDTLNTDAEIVKSILEHANISAYDEPFIDAEMVKANFGDTKITAEEILDRAKNYTEPADPAIADKAKAYDKMVKNAIDETIKIGIKAKGDGFKEDKWRKILNSFDYDEIIDQKSEWEEEAKNALNAGKRVSQPWEQGPASSTTVNPDSYNFCR